MMITTYNYWTYHDIFSTVGGYFGLILPFLEILAPLFTMKFFLEMAEVMKGKYEEDYAQDLRETIAKYQDKTDQDWEAIPEGEECEELEKRFDKVTTFYLAAGKNLYKVQDQKQVTGTAPNSQQSDAKPNIVHPGPSETEGV